MRAGDEETLGWRPAAGQEIPRRHHWHLEGKLGDGGFGEVWLARHDKTRDHRVFKFCYDAERLRALKREVTLFRILKDTLGERDDIARILDWNFEEAPYFLEAEYIGVDLQGWAEAQGGAAAVPLPFGWRSSPRRPPRWQRPTRSASCTRTSSRATSSLRPTRRPDRRPA